MGSHHSKKTQITIISACLRAPKSSIVLILCASQDGADNLDVFDSPQENFVHGFCLSRSTYLGISKNRRIAMEHEHSNAGHNPVSDRDCQLRVFDSIQLSLNHDDSISGLLCH